jgi:hypothetical protein
LCAQGGLCSLYHTGKGTISLSNQFIINYQYQLSISRVYLLLLLLLLLWFLVQVIPAAPVCWCSMCLTQLPGVLVSSPHPGPGAALLQGQQGYSTTAGVGGEQILLGGGRTGWAGVHFFLGKCVQS